MDFCLYFYVPLFHMLFLWVFSNCNVFILAQKMMLRQDMKQQDLVPDDVSVEDLNRLGGRTSLEEWVKLISDDKKNQQKKPPYELFYNVVVYRFKTSLIFTSLRKEFISCIKLEELHREADFTAAQQEDHIRGPSQVRLSRPSRNLRVPS